MKSSLSKSLWFGLLLSCSALAQHAGMEPEWDVRAILKEISAHANRLLPVLNQVQAQSWTEKGAPDAYAAQLNSAKAQAGALSNDALELARNPEKLSLGLKTFFRMQSLEFTLRSLNQGIRKYQTSALADDVDRLLAENGANRERLQRYIVDLAAEREQQFQVMDSEAQRCRAFLARQPVNPPRSSGRK